MIKELILDVSSGEIELVEYSKEEAEIINKAVLSNNKIQEQ